MKTILNPSKLIMMSLLIMIGIFVQAQKKVITKNELPKIAQSFINSNFKDQTISSSIEETKINKKEYYVLLSNGMEIEFNGQGEWKEVDGNRQVIPTNIIPAKIANYINTNYPNTTVYKIDKGFHKYETKLSNGLELEFSLTGDFLRIDN